MTVRELLAKLDGVHPSTRVLLPAGDHSYRDAEVVVGTALYAGRGRWSEDFGEGYTPEGEFGKRLPVVVIR